LHWIYVCILCILLLQSFFHIFPECLGSIAILYREDLVTRTCEYEIASLVATLRSDVDDSVSIGDDVEIVLDDEYRVSFLYETIEDIEELLYIGEVEPRGWLIEDIERLSCRSLGEVECELDTLRLSS
jgi:hypothetical protein